MSTPQVQPLSEAAILAATDELAAKVPELADATLVRPWAISACLLYTSDAADE